jgi:hypothetical protein
MKAFKSFFKEINPEISYDPEELKKGIEVELEHTNYRAIATIIAKHHLAEDPKYYTKLASVESKPKSEDAEDVHKPVRPGILKRQVSGKLTCSKARALKSKQKNKGNNTAKAAQRYLNYHC